MVFRSGEQPSSLAQRESALTTAAMQICEIQAGRTPNQMTGLRLGRGPFEYARSAGTPRRLALSEPYGADRPDDEHRKPRATRAHRSRSRGASRAAATVSSLHPRADGVHCAVRAALVIGPAR